MKKFLKVLSLMLALCLVLTSCGGGLFGKKKDDKVVELTMYLVGNKPKDYDKVLKIVNEKLVEDIGATVDVKFLGWGEWREQLPLILQGSEADLVVAADYHPHRDYALKGAYMDITDMFEKYCPNLAKQLDPEIYESVLVNGKLFWVPCNNAGTNPHGYVVRGDLMDKYGMEDIGSGDEFIEYLLKVKENEKGLVPYNASKSDITIYTSKYNPILGNVIFYDTTESEKDQFKNLYTYQEKEFEDYYNHQSEMLQKGYKAGCWPADVFMNQNPSKDAFIAGTSAATILNYSNFNDLYIKVTAEHPEWEPRFYYRLSDEQGPPPMSAGNGVAVARKSKNPEKALQLLDLLNTNKEYNRLTSYGIEGEHYVEVEPGRYAFPEGVDMSNTGFAPDDAGNWGWGNKEFYMISVDSVDTYEANKKKFNEMAAFNPYAAFTKDDSTFVTEYAAVNNILGKNSSLINWGMADRKTLRKQEIKELQDAGIDKIIKEMKKQIKAYAKTKK